MFSNYGKTHLALVIAVALGPIASVSLAQAAGDASNKPTISSIPTPKPVPKPAPSIVAYIPRDLHPNWSQRSSSFNGNLGNLHLRDFDGYGLQKVKRYIHRFTTEYGWADIFRQAGRNGRLQTCKAVFREEGMPEDLCWTVQIESQWKRYAQSYSGAQGYWQFEPGTAAMWCRGANLSDIAESSRCAARYLRYLHGQTESWSLALAAFNGGPTTLDIAIREGRSHDFWEICMAGGLLSYETREYVPQILATIEIGNHPGKYGLKIPGIND